MKMTPLRLDSEHSQFLLSIAVGTALFLFGACGRPNQPKRVISAAEKIWYNAEYRHRTNDLPTAYSLLLNDKNELSQMATTKPKELNYHYCLAILNSRLFLMARSLGYTNEAADFLRQASFHFNAQRLAPTNYAPEDIEAKINRYDASVHAVSTNFPPIQ